MTVEAVRVPAIEARIAPVDEPDLVGSLRAFSLSDLLQLIALSGQTGTLHLTQGWNGRTLTFERGRVTYIAAATRLPSTIELLVASGRVDPMAAEAANAACDAGGRSPEQTLLDVGAIEQSDLARCRERQLEETIYTLFLWRNCRFTFRVGQVERAAGGITVDVASERLIVDGTRRVDEWIAISPRVPSVRLIYVPTGVGEPGSLDAAINDRLDVRRDVADVAPPNGDGAQASGDAAICARLDGRRDVATVAQATGLTQFEVARGLSRMVDAGTVRAVLPDRVRITSLFRFLLESIHMKLTLYGYASEAAEFERELARFATDNGLKVRMQGGKVLLTDQNTPLATTELIDLYRLFIAIQNNRFRRRFAPDIVHGLVEGLYIHLDLDDREMMRMYEFVQIEGLLGAAAV
ncbi:MAG: DUF4388 domain-containing protein [Chloroflexota bacterium]|nr:MAG: DUF4388 domain-containing protein [Chloroflexota bacterium]